MVSVPLTKTPVTNRTSSDIDSIRHWYLLLLHTQCFSRQWTHYLVEDSRSPHYKPYISYHSQLSLTHNTLIRHQRIIVCGIWYSACWKDYNPSRFSSPSRYAECACTMPLNPKYIWVEQRIYHILYFIPVISMSSNSHYFTLVEGPHAALPTILYLPASVIVRSPQTT